MSKTLLMEETIAQIIEHRGAHRILLRFSTKSSWNKRIRGIADARWSKTYGAWHIPDTMENRRMVGLMPNTEISAETTTRQLPKQRTRISEKNLLQLKRLVEQLILKKYSRSTITTYRNEFTQLLMKLGDVPVEDLQPEHLRRYMIYCAVELGLSENTLHSRLNAIKFYFEQVLHRPRFLWEIPRPKKPLQIPRFFSQDEVVRIIQVVQNIKHKAMLMLCYSTGMRVSEVVSIKTANIMPDRRCILVERAKGKKDRLVQLSPVLLVILRAYARQYRPDKQGYLFAGQEPGTPYSTRSLQIVLQEAKRKAGICKDGSIHALRHSFATHLLDKGTDISIIQKLLGHQDIKTTLRYLHTTNKDLLKVVSPLDDLHLNFVTKFGNKNY